MRERLMATTLSAVSLLLTLSHVSTALTVNVKEAPYNAQGDGNTDDTAAIQAAITAAFNANEASTVNFPEGTYIVAMVQLRIGTFPITLQTLSGNNRAIIKTKADSDKWMRNFSTTQYPYSGANDSAVLKFTNLEFDGNLANQGVYQNYELEHQASIFAMADTNSTGRLVVEISDCAFHDGVADAINIHTNVKATISNVTSENYFRGGIVCGGGGSEVHVTDWIHTAGDNLRALDIEIKSVGYGMSYASDYYFTDCNISSLDVGFTNGGSFTGETITVTGEGSFYIYAPNSTVNITNSVFYAGGDYAGNYSHIKSYGNTTFENCTFYAMHKGGGNSFAPIRICV